MILKMVLNPEKLQIFFGNLKAVKIHLISKGLEMPTNPSIARADTPVLRGAVDVMLLGAYPSKCLQECLHSSHF